MKRPERVIGHVTPWVDYADALEADMAELKKAYNEMISQSQDQILELQAKLAELEGSAERA